MADREADYLPGTWQVGRLGDVMRLEYGVSLPERDRRPGRVPVYGSAGRVGWHDEAEVAGPGIVVGRKGSIGSVSWVPEDFVPIDTTYFAAPLDGQADLRWLFHTLAREDLSTLNRATGVPGLSRDDVYALRRPVPPLPEQRAIAAVLDSIDETIERTDEVIANTERLRDALLHELLTRGLPGHHTAWRDVPGLGTIPASWEVARLGDVTAEMVYGPRFPADRYARDGNVVTLRTTDISENGAIDWSEAPAANLDTERFAQFLLRSDDIVVTRSGTCGIAAIFRGHQKPVLPGAFLIRMRAVRVEPDWIALFLNASIGRAQTRRAQSGGVQKNLNGPSLRAVLLPVPPAAEREAILRVLSAVTETTAATIEEARLLLSEKEALADVLLTGRVRVG